MVWLGTLQGWTRRKSKFVNGTSAGLQPRYQLLLSVYKGGPAQPVDSSTDVFLGGNCKDDFGDIRFTDSDGTTLLNYYLESTGTDIYGEPKANVWVNIPNLSTSGKNIYIYYNNPSATTLSDPSNTFINYATGGILSTVGISRIHTFTSNGTLSNNNSITAKVLVVAGGGGGAGTDNIGDGGGGGGGVIYNASYGILAGTTSITVGNGGGINTNGQNSVFGTLIAFGGGAGGRSPAWNNGYVGNNGGSGGGGGGEYYSNHAGGSGISGQGYAGGTGIALPSHLNYYGGGGGGGAGGPGGSSGAVSQKAGNGGIGLLNNITGTDTYYGGGGGGYARDVYGGSYTGNTAIGGTGGAGGGGNGGYLWENGSIYHLGTAGIPNTGGGGGASYPGGSGIVIVNYNYRNYLFPEPTFGSSANEEVNITAIAMALDTLSCTGSCTVNVFVTWYNYGNADIIGFTPTIIIDSTIQAYGAPISIPSMGSASSGAVTTPLLSTGFHEICPIPN